MMKDSRIADSSAREVSDGLLKKIKDDILKSGYPLELFCEQVLCKYPWVLGSTEYYPAQSGAYRRIDIEACLRSEWRLGKQRYYLASDLWVECKKSESSPWVFLQGGFPNEPNIVSNIPDIERHFDQRFFSRKSHDYCKVEEMSKNYVIPFKKPDSKEHAQIYDAISNLTDYFHYHASGRASLKMTEQRLLCVSAVHLCIVLDGLLLFGEFEDGDLQLRRVTRTCVYHSKWIGERFRNCSIDVVTKEHFAEYVASVERNHKFLVSYLLKRLSKVRK